MAVIIETILDIFELDGLPCFNEDDEKSPPNKVVELERRIRAADAILFVTPEYNYSVPDDQTWRRGWKKAMERPVCGSRAWIRCAL